MKRITFTLFVGILLGLPLLAKPPAQKPPNVLFVSVDDMNDWVGCLGSPRVATPNIDALAKQGMLFTNAHAPSPKCAPSRAAILTGRRPSTTGLYDNGHWWRPAYPDLITLPQFFKQHGYYVAGGGKVHHHTPGFNPPDQWHEYFDLVADQELVKSYLALRGSRKFLTDMPRHPNGSLDWGPLDVSDMEMGDGHTVKWAGEFLARKHDKPFFLAVGLFQPHLPFYAPAKYFKKKSLETIILPTNKSGDLDDIPDGGQVMAAYRRNDLRMIEETGGLKHCVQSYECSIAHADTLIGKLMSSLDSSQYKDNTIVVFWSDHGYHFGEKDHFAKNTLWERSTHVPFIMVVPGLTAAGAKCDRAVDLTCLYPTLTLLCDLPVPAGLDGVDIRPLLRDANAEWNRPAITEFRQGNTAIRQGDWRYIRYRSGGEELYQHQQDPHEWNNLAGQAEYSSIQQKLGSWVPPQAAEPMPSKKAYDFDPVNFTWKHKQTGEISRGRQMQ